VSDLSVQRHYYEAQIDTLAKKLDSMTVERDAFLHQRVRLHGLLEEAREYIITQIPPLCRRAGVNVDINAIVQKIDVGLEETK